MVLLAAGIASAQPNQARSELTCTRPSPAFLEPYKKGMELARGNHAAGGLLGRPLELVIRDDTGKPGDAVRVAEELITREKVDLLMGTFSSAVGLAVADLARQRKVLFLASEPLTDKIVWENGNRFTFRLRPSTYMQTAMLVPIASELHKRRWAIVYPNYEYGKSATAAFKQQMIARQAAGAPDRICRARGAARQNRRRTGGAGDDRQQARCLSRHVCGRPLQIRARGGVARSVQGPARFSARGEPNISIR